MPYENIEVKITKKGEIIVRIQGTTEQRLRDFSAFLEEVIGPISGAKRIDAPSWEREAQLAEEKEKHLERQQG